MKQSSTSVVVMSDAERRERLRNRIYAVFPVVSVLLLILLWFLAAGAENSTFPSPCLLYTSPSPRDCSFVGSEMCIRDRWFGTGEFPKILIVFIGALMPVVVNTQAGISNVQNMYLNVGTIFHANKRQMLFEIAIPSALDAIFAGVRTSTSAGWMVVLAAEMLGGKSGIGFLITRGMDSGDYALCLLSMVCIGLVGALLAIITQLLERMVCPWTAKKSN